MAVVAGVLLTTVGLLNGCEWALSLIPDEDEITHVAGRYYTAAMGETGTALHWYQDEFHYGTEPLLEAVYDTRLCGGYLVARAGTDFYVVYPVQVQSLEEARQKRQGPFERKELMQALLRLTGDTTLRQTGNF
ncbi:hypothetical protein [Hymenobacter endophyticus]|uniref:hypothetical protein n=1 Tax=Hymenobacter endophyticus TaxID=3076335 RepID=UPI00290598B9|nr:hypothetical protein [Hymenobacter endophyticus]